MKKQAAIATTLMLIATPTIASNACYINGKTVFQKEPCPVQEAENLSQFAREVEAYSRLQDRRIRDYEKAQQEEIDRAARLADGMYKNSPEGRLEAQLKRMERQRIVEQSNREIQRINTESKIDSINRKLDQQSFDRLLE